MEPFQGIAPAIAIQGTGVPEILPPQKLMFKAPDAQRHLPPQSRVFEAPGSFHPRLDIEASDSKRLIACELHHLPRTIQGTGVPEILPPQKLVFKAPDAQRHLPLQSRVFEAPGSFHPRLDI